MILTVTSRRLYIGLGAIFAANAAHYVMMRATLNLSNMHWFLAMAARFGTRLLF